MRALGLIAICASVPASCTNDSPAIARADPDAAERGRLALEQYGCGTCHVIPGVRGAIGLVGPPLSSFARRVYIAGELPNEPEVLVRWIQDPAVLVPQTAMPDLGVSEARSREMAAYLYHLR